MRQRVSSLGTALLLTLASLAIADDARYTIHLDRNDAKPGDKDAYEVVYAAVITNHTVWDGVTPVDSERSTGIRLAVDREILEAKDGIVLAAAYTVRTYTRLKDERDVEILPAGKRFAARLEGDRTVFTIDGKPVPDDINTDLSRLIRFVRPEDVTFDEKQLGITGPKAVGETWPIDAAATASAGRRAGLAIEDMDVSGTAMLVAVEPGDHGQLLRVRADVTIRNLSQPSAKPPPGAHLRSLSVTSQREWLTPTDPDRPAPWGSRKATWRFVTDGHVEDRPYIDEQTVVEQLVGRRLPDGNLPPTTQAIRK